MTTRHDRGVLTESGLDELAWLILGSEFTALTYANWPVERRVDAYLTHHGMTDLVNDGDAYEAVLQRVLSNVGPALRNGVLADTSWRRRSEARIRSDKEAT